MNKRWKNVLLLCSLLFNVILAGFIIYHAFTKPLPRPIPPRIPTNREQLREKHREISLKRSEFIEYKQRFIDALASSDFKEADARILLKELLEKQNDLEHTICSNLIELRKKMDDEQAGKFFSRFPHRTREFDPKLPRRR